MSKQSKWDGEVPFIDGQMQDYSDWVPRYGEPKPTVQRWNNKQIVWEKAQEFAASLKLRSWGRGRSSVRFYFDDLTTPGRGYSMATSAFYESLKAFDLVNGVMKGTFTFRKQGSNFGLYPVIKKEKNDGIEACERFLSQGKVLTEEEFEAELDREQRRFEDEGVSS